MNAQLTSIAEKCLNAAYDGSMDFPGVVGTLIGAGFEGYAVDYRRSTSTYYLPDGDNVTLANVKTDGHVAAAFDTSELRAAIREAQVKAPGYSYKGFCVKAKACGCAGYVVSFLGRQVLYYGRTAETHTEKFPDK